MSLKKFINIHYFFRYLLENGADVAAVNYDGEVPVDISESDAMADMLHKIIEEKGKGIIRSVSFISYILFVRGYV